MVRSLRCPRSGIWAELAREKEEILIEIKKHRISKGVLKVDPGLVDEVIENEELFE